LVSRQGLTLAPAATRFSVLESTGAEFLV
jgi:hypothetical protein